MLVHNNCRASVFRFIFFLLCTFYLNNLYAGQKSVLFLTNSMTSDQNRLISCSVKINGQLQNCQELKTSMNLVNPIALAANDKHLFIAHYGHEIFGRTSFVTKCELPRNNTQTLNCEGMFGIVSDAHLTGMEVVGDKFYFTHSFSHKNNINTNYFVSCDLVEGKRAPQCGPIHHLNSGLPIPQLGVNKIMDIKVNDKNIFINDYYGKTFFNCSLPNKDNEVSCSYSEFLKNNPNYYTTTLDINRSNICTIQTNGINVFEENNLNCCHLDSEMCSTIKNSGFFNPISLQYNSSDRLGLYIANGYSNNLLKSPDSPLSYCTYDKTNTFIENCEYLDTQYKDLNDSLKNFVNVSVIKILDLSL